MEMASHCQEVESFQYIPYKTKGEIIVERASTRKLQWKYNDKPNPAKPLPGRLELGFKSTSNEICGLVTGKFQNSVGTETSITHRMSLSKTIYDSFWYVSMVTNNSIKSP